jgi:hypothetical protein
MLLSIMQMYGGVDHQMYALQTVQADIRETNGRTLLFEYPLDNTWTYEVAIKPLGKNHQMYTPWLDVRFISWPINRALTLSYFSQFQNALGCQSVSRVFPSFVSVW